MITVPPVWLANFSPKGVAAGEVYGNQRTASGAYQGVAVGLEDPTKVRLLTQGNPLYGAQDTHRGISDVSPDGTLMLLHVVNVKRLPPWSNAHPDEARPGKGAYCDVWLATTDGTQAWKLSDITADRALGTFWARFDSTGTRVVFSEIMRPAWWPEYLGGEQLVVGTLDWSTGAPLLADRKVLGNGRQYYEPYGFTADGTAVVACSNWHRPGLPLKAQAFLFPIDGSTPQRLTTALGDDYQEFAYLRPDGTGYVVTSGYFGWIGSADRWLVSAAAPNAAPTRVTHLANWAAGVPVMNCIAGGLAFIDDDLAVSGHAANGLETAYLIEVP